MLGSSVLGGSSGSPTKSRVFVYEVTGLKQNENNDNNNYQFRSSSSVFVRVAYNRMNEEMQRISRMGGTIVNIQPLESFQQSNQANVQGTDNSEEEE